MKLKFIGKNIEVTDALREITAKKFEKLDKFFSKDIEGKVTYSAVKNDKIFVLYFFVVYLISIYFKKEILWKEILCL